MKNIHDLIQNCEPITPDQAITILVHQASHSAPNDTDMDQGYTEEARDTLKSLIELKNEMCRMLENLLGNHQTDGAMGGGDVGLSRAQELRVKAMIHKAGGSYFGMDKDIEEGKI